MHLSPRERMQTRVEEGLLPEAGDFKGEKQTQSPEAVSGEAGENCRA